MGSTDPRADAAAVVLRPADPADPADVEAVAEVHRTARSAAVPAMPEPVHPARTVLPWVRGRMEAEDTETWVAEADGHVVGYALLEPAWLDQLYVLPDHAGQGIGSALLEVVKSRQPGGFGLWVFETNEPARRFYRRHGLVELEHTDGSGNDEHAPDVRVAWLGAEPMAFLRRQVDEVDDELAALLARRAALTARIQEHKPVPGHAGRDPEREREIVARMTRKAPALGEEGWRRVVDAVISASLDAAERG